MSQSDERLSYLQYYAVIRKYISMHYQLTEQQVEFMLYIDSLKYFSVEDVANYSVIMRNFPIYFKDLLTRNFISIHTEKRRLQRRKLRSRIGYGAHKKLTVYRISTKGMVMITKMYQLTEQQREYNHTSKSDVLGKYRLNMKVEALRNLILEMMKVIHEHREKKNYKPEFDHLLDF